MKMPYHAANIRGKTMSESTNVEDNRQPRQKPPLSLRRITCEILAGTATAFAVAAPLVCVILFANADKYEGCFGGLQALAIILYGFPVA
jgi:hypothetical protein